MPKLYLIDHSLSAPGGHHFDSARLLLAAAARAGLKPVVAAHRRFRTSDGFAADMPIHSLFSHTAYSDFSATIGGAVRPQDPLGAPPIQARDSGPGTSNSDVGLDSGSNQGGWLRRLRTRWDAWRMRSQTRAFAAACEALFQRTPAESGDQVFLPTLTEFDLAGVVEFFRRSSASAAARTCRWHLQFHYPFLKGPLATYDRQGERREAMRRHLSTLVARANASGRTDWRFYAPTQALVDQYNSLGVVEFELLEHPVDVAAAPFAAPDSSSGGDQGAGGRPLRVLCAGGLRADKGAGLLSRLLDDLGRDDFADGAIQLWVQAKRASKLRRFAAGHSVTSITDFDQPPPVTARLVHVPHPLPTAQYVELLRRADVGLLAYDAASYAARCSGVLVELLAAGVPAIVPADTWLAEELFSAHSPPPGLVASSAADYAAQLRTMAARREEFAQLARSAAPSYACRHSPDQVIERICSPHPSKRGHLAPPR